MFIKSKMLFKYKDFEYPIEVVRKNNKKTYIRVRDNKICITTNYFVGNNEIRKLVNDNYVSIGKMIDKVNVKKDRDSLFLLFGKKYDIVFDESVSISIVSNIIYVKNEKILNKWLMELIETTYLERLKYWYDLFLEDIPSPNLKIRKMKTRWGVCNTKNNNITLNLELSKYDIECLDYVIVHELAHFVEANHSKKFWLVVEKYYPNYKEIRKKLRD